MGNEKATDDMMWKALEKVNLKEFVESQNGLSTLVAEKGSNFSGGQCQRLAIARALLHDTPIYLFDEATSNIDVESENDIINIIKTIAKTKTVIMISHRLANVVDADKIFVLNKGRIVGNGNHYSLLRHNHTYQNLWNTQNELESCVRGEELCKEAI